MQTVHTERLVLRQLRESDGDAYAAMSADPEVMRYIGDGKPLTRDESWRSLAFMLGHWQLRGYGQWAAEERASGQFVGRIGLYNPAGWPGLEVGWMLRREFWGRGYATEGVRAALAIAFDELKPERIISLIQPGNEPSIRVALRIGESLTGQVPLNGREVLLYAITRDDWRRLAGAD